MRLPKELARNFNLRAGSRITFLEKSFSFEVKPEIKDIWHIKSKNNLMKFYSRADAIYDQI